MKEIWKDIKGYEGCYQISNLGRVKSIGYGEERYLRLCLNQHGYYRVDLYKDKIRTIKTVHQLVAEAFLGHTPCGFELVVNHINFDRLDNRVLNLEIVTPRENGNKKHLKSTSKYVGVCWNKNSNKWVSTIYINGKQEHLGYFKCELAAAKAYQDKLNSL